MADVSNASAAASKPAADADPLVGRVINDRFRIVAPIARGGMGKVYRAEQAPLGRQVALKVLNPNYRGDNDPEFHKRFFLEASTCSRLTHPNTVTIFDYGRTDDDIYFIAMELLEGRTLHRALRQDGRFDAERAMHVARQVCRSLREAHAQGVIHRDLKPANVFLIAHGDETDYVKVLDFGLVKDLESSGEDLTQTGLFMGSPKYMSPEQVQGEKLDPRSDVYSLGVILYEMLTGTVPFDRPNSVNILMAHVHEPAPPMREANPDVQVPPALEAVVMRALAKDVDDRFASMDAMHDALKQLAKDAGMSFTRSTEVGIDALDSGATHAVAARRDETATASLPAHAAGGATARAASAGPATAGAASAGASGPEGGAAGAASTASEAPPAPGARSRASLWAAILGALALGAAIAVAVALRDEPPTGPQADAATAQAATTADEPSGSDPIDPSETEPSETEPGETEPSETEPGETERSRSGFTASGGAAPGADRGQDEPPVLRTMVQLRSEPAGAMVTVGERRYGPTPADVEWAGEDAERGREVTFHFTLAGHREYTVTRVITGDSLNVQADLERVPAPPRPRRRRRHTRPGSTPGPETTDEAAGQVRGYKMDPY